MPKRKEGYCNICGEFCEVVCTGYSSGPFVDGKKYDEICHVCHCVPKTCEYDEENDEWIHYDYLEDKKLRTVAEMMEDGWDKAEAAKSVKAVKAAIKRAKGTK